MPRNNEILGEVSTSSAGGFGTANTLFGGRRDDLAQQRLAAQLRDPGLPSMLGQDIAFDPNRIIITENMIAKPVAPETPEMARVSALRRAAFRTDAELSLLSNLERARSESFGNTRLDDQEATSLFRQRASLLTRDAIEDASRKFGTPEDGLEMPTRAVLEDMVEGVASEGARARARGLEEKALDILEAGADDLLAQIRRAPDLAQGYGAQMEAMIQRYDGAVDADALAAFRANTAGEMAQAYVLGLAQAGRFDDARTVLGAVALSDAQKATLEEAVDAETARASEVSQATRARRRFALELAAQEGQDLVPELEDAQMRGQIAPPEMARLKRLAQEQREQRILHNRLTRDVDEAFHGYAPAPDPATREGRLGLELYAQGALKAALEDESPERQAAMAAAFMARFDYVPQGIHSELMNHIQPGQPAALRMAAVRRLAAIAVADGALYDAMFPKDVQAFVSTAMQAEHDNEVDKIAYADSTVEITSRPPTRERRGEGDGEEERSINPLDTADAMAERGIVEGQELGIAYMEQPGTNILLPIPVGASDQTLASFDDENLEAAASRLGLDHAVGLITDTLSDPNRMRVGPGVAQSSYVRDLEDGTSLLVTLETQRDDNGHAIFQVASAAVLPNDQLIVLEKGFAANVADASPLSLLTEPERGEDGNIVGIPKSVELVDPETGRTFVLGPERFDELSQMQRISLGLDEGDPFGELIAELVLDITPIVGEIRSALAAADNVEAAVEAFADGDFSGGMGETGLAALNALGATPFLGIIARGLKAGRKVDEIAEAIASEQQFYGPSYDIFPRSLGAAANTRLKFIPGQGDAAARLDQHRSWASKLLDTSLSPSQAFNATDYLATNVNDARQRVLAAFDLALLGALRGNAQLQIDRVVQLAPDGVPLPVGVRWGEAKLIGDSRIDGLGLEHIVAKHGPEAIKVVADLLAQAAAGGGRVVQEWNPSGTRLTLRQGVFRVFLDFVPTNANGSFEHLLVVSGFKKDFEPGTFNPQDIVGPLTFGG